MPLIHRYIWWFIGEAYFTRSENKGQDFCKKFCCCCLGWSAVSCLMFSFPLFSNFKCFRKWNLALQTWRSKVLQCEKWDLLRKMRTHFRAFEDSSCYFYRRYNTEYGIWDLKFWAKLGLFWDPFWTFLGLLSLFSWKGRRKNAIKAKNALSRHCSIQNISVDMRGPESIKDMYMIHALCMSK